MEPRGNQVVLHIYNTVYECSDSTVNFSHALHYVQKRLENVLFKWRISSALPHLYFFQRAV